MKKRLLALAVCLALCLGFAPAALAEEQTPAAPAAPTVFKTPNDNYEVYANGRPIKIVAGTEEGRTNILYDKNGDGAIGDTEYLQIGDDAPTDAGYDLTEKPTFTMIYGGTKEAPLDGDTRIEMTGGSVGTIQGAGASTVTGDTNITVTGGKADMIYGGNSLVGGRVKVTVGGDAQINTLSGGGANNDITVEDNAQISNLYANEGTVALTVTGGFIDFLLYYLNPEHVTLTVGGTAKIGSGEDGYGVNVGGESGLANIRIAPALTDGAKVCVVLSDDLIEKSPYTLTSSCADPTESVKHLTLFPDDSGTWTAAAGENAITATYTPPEPPAPPAPPAVDEDHRAITASDALKLRIGAGQEEGTAAILYAAADAGDEAPATALTIGGKTEYDLRGWTITAPSVYMAGGAVGEVGADTLTVVNSAVVGGGNGRGLVVGGALEKDALQVVSTAKELDGLPGVGLFTGHVTIWLSDGFDQPEPTAFYDGIFSEQPDRAAILNQFTLAGPGAAKGQLRYQEAFDEKTGDYAAAVSLENAPTPLGGDVTEFVPGTTYSISSKAELERLAELVNSGKSGEGCVFALTADVNLAGGEENPWPSIGRKGDGGDAPFAGVFDGGGHAVSGLYIGGGNACKGLFAYVASGGVVRDLTVSDQAGVVGGGSNTGGLVGCNEGRVENCVSSVSVSGAGDNVGGLVSRNASGGVISGCVNHGAVVGASVVGGIVGDNSGTVTGCVNHGAVRGTLDVGGVTGHSMGGGIARCQNNGSVSLYENEGVGYCGGVAGNTERAVIEDCVNTGGVTARPQDAQAIGGIVGHSGGGTLNACYNIGPVSSAGEKVGGVAGQMQGTAATDCVSLGLSVSGGEDAGRVAGVLSSGTFSAGFARSDLSLTGGAMTAETAAQTGRDGESVAPAGDWQKTAFAGWDFDAVWNEGAGDRLPTLKAVKNAPITLPRPASHGDSSGSGGGESGSGGGSSSGHRPSVTAGAGGTVRADGKGNVTITPDGGWRIASVTVNGKAVDIPEHGVLTGLKSRDKVAVTFEKIPPAPVPILTPDQFTDLDSDAWYYGAVSYVLADGLFQGTSPTQFSPNASMSRAMILTVLHRVSGERGEAADGASWYAPALAWAMEHGISDGSDPDGEITREQLATMLYRYAKTLPGYTPEGSGAAASFSDYDAVSGYAEDAVRWAVGHGILTGKGNERLDPAGTATRAETAAMLQRFIEMNAK